MKDLVKKILKEEEYKMQSFFVPMFERDGIEYVIDIKDSFENDHDNYGHFYIEVERLDYFNSNPAELIKISSRRKEIATQYHLSEMQGYEQEYGGRNQDDMVNYSNEDYEEWVDYSGFNVDENREGIYAIQNMYVVEFHTNIVRSDDSHNMMSQLTDE